MSNTSWHQQGPNDTRWVRRPSEPSSVEGWYTLDKRHGGRPIFVGRDPADPIPTKPEVVMEGAAKDYEEKVREAQRKNSEAAYGAVEAAQRKMAQAIREAPAKAKSCPIDNAQATVRPRSFSNTAKPCTPSTTEGNLLVLALFSTLTTALPQQCTLVGTINSSPDFSGNSAQLFTTNENPGIAISDLALDAFASIEILGAVNCTLERKDWKIRIEGPITAMGTEKWFYTYGTEANSMLVNDTLSVTAIHNGASTSGQTGNTDFEVNCRCKQGMCPYCLQCGPFALCCAANWENRRRGEEMAACRE
ncbi:hypothetical protein K458DRAFT_393110 [Lentithecium fluviatile CBS 122367]|uniref:Uncharacterized protein n=1 Tax=Lentithecium fluviatile CBS 122367 TaxID=1168545 RepID=A0A6G1IPG8_9PLEO|nr:hypothetical protein K458DRAFT_393110 [Lentithecium fluviatile CBS 122367]